MIPLRRILVPVSGHPTDEEALALACEFSRKFKAEVIVIYVIEVKRTLPLDVDLPPEAARGDSVLSHAEEFARSRSVQPGTELLQARDVGTAIVDEAVERDVDLVVMGITYKRKYGEFDLGRAATYVLKNAPMRVWLVRAAPAPDGQVAAREASSVSGR